MDVGSGGAGASEQGGHGLVWMIPFSVNTPCSNPGEIFPCNICSSGYIWSGAACVSCAAGTYSKSGDQTCTNCPAGKFSNNTSSTFAKCFC